MTINGKTQKTLDVIILDQLKNWDKIKGVSDWVNVLLTNYKQPQNTDHFAFGFKTKNPKDIANFNFLLLDGDANLINFVDGEKKVPVLNFKTETLK